MVVALENIVQMAPYVHWQLIAGHFPFCLGSCCRFADLVHFDSIFISESGKLQLIEASSKVFKFWESSDSDEDSDSDSSKASTLISAG